jgi:hypothetical protein
MDIFVQPSEPGVKRLLKASQLNSSDLTPEHLRHFFGLGTKEEPEGIVGLEVFATWGRIGFKTVGTRRGLCSEPRYKIYLSINQHCRIVFQASRLPVRCAGRCTVGDQGDKRVFRDLPGEFGLHGKTPVSDYLLVTNDD